jgi:putative ABC transport system permease protein
VFGNYFKVAVRNLLRHKVYSAINIAGLAVGLACCMGIMIFIQFVLSSDNFHEKGDRICRVISIMKSEGKSPIHTPSVSGPVGPNMMNDYPEVENYSRFVWQWRSSVRYNGKWIDLGASASTDPSVFDVFTFKMKSGDPKTALSDPKSIVLTEETAKKIFGEDEPLGKILFFPDAGDFRVTGILEEIPANSLIRFEYLLPIDKNRLTWINDIGRIGLITYVLLKDGADRANLERKVATFSQKYYGESADHYSFYLQPLKDVFLHSGHISGEPPIVLVLSLLSALCLLILVIACVNYMNLSTARASSRAREVGIRKVFGAERKNLIRQFLGESIIQSLLAMLAVGCFVELALPYFNDVSHMQLKLSWLVLFAIVAVALFAGLLAGSYPAFVLSSFQPLRVLKGISKTGTRGLLLRRILVVTQLVFSVVLIVCTLLIGRQAKYLMNKDMGFNKSQVAIVPMSDKVRDQYETIRQELLRNPSITDVAASSSKLGWVSQILQFDFEGRKPDDSWQASFISVDYDFISFYGIELTQGRNFSKDFATDFEQGYIINEALAKKLGWDSAVGKRFGTNGQMGVVIGVVKDFNYSSLQNKIQPLILRLAPGNSRMMSLRLTPGDTQNKLKIVEKIISRYEYDQPFKYSFLDEDIVLMYQPLMIAARVAASAAFLAIMIACLGLFGLISFSTQERSKEIGIRKVLGASVRDILLLLSREYLMLVGISILIAWSLAWFVIDIFLRNFAYRIAIGPVPFILGGLVVLIITAATLSFQAEIGRAHV